MKRLAGILLPVSALPNDFGIGDLGPGAKKWLDILHKNHIHLWQMLPLNPLGYGHSPYQPYSSKAGEPLLISPEWLLEKGYIKEEDILHRSYPEGQASYEEAEKEKDMYFHIAYATMKMDSEKEIAFAKFKDQERWARDYAVYSAFKKFHDLKSWTEWEKPYRDWPQTRDPRLLRWHQDEIDYAMFLQFLFYEQFYELKAYAKKQDVLLMGDIPFYVGLDSVDVWMNRDQFLLDKEGRPTYIAGVPPDYFSPTGQRWGNPIYAWDKMKKDHYAFWTDRLRHISRLFDIIRIDHFRAFDTYWKIPASCPTAIEGKWILGPSHDFFDNLKKTLPRLKIVAEDLGDLRPEVLKLRDDYKLPGMQVIQFHFDPDTDNTLIEKTRNLVLYTGTHDNQTLFSWYLDLPFEKRAKTWQYLCEHGYKETTIDLKIIHYVLKSKADTVIFPAQDILFLKDEGRLNTPGTLGDPNWKWRLKDYKDIEDRLALIKPWIKDTKRG